MRLLQQVLLKHVEAMCDPSGCDFAVKNMMIAVGADQKVRKSTRNLDVWRIMAYCRDHRSCKEIYHVGRTHM